MKTLKFTLVMLLSVVAVDAMAWTAEVNKAILLFAEENLSNKTKARVESILDKPLSAVVFANKGKNQTRLNEAGKSVTTAEGDAVVRLEKALATFSNENTSMAEMKAALLEVVELTVDIHCPSNILIDKRLEGDFTFGRDNGRPKGSRWFKVQPRKWQAMWHERYHKDHGAFSAEMYLYDWKIATKGMAKQYKKAAVAPRVWAEHTGARVLESLKTFQPDAVVNMLEITKQEPVNDAAMFDAAFRLARVLNVILK